MSEELNRFSELVKNGYLLTHYLDANQKDVYQAYALGGDVIKSHNASETLRLAHKHLMERLEKGNMNEFADLTTDELLSRLETLKPYHQEALERLEASEQDHWSEESQMAAYDRVSELADKMHKLEWEIKERWAKEDESKGN